MIGVASGVDLVLPVSSFVFRELEILGIEPGKMRLVPSGVNTEIFVPKETRSRGIPRILFVGRFSLGKGVPYLIKAADILRKKYDFRLLLVGGTRFDNGYFTSISMIRELGLGDIVEVMPPVPHSRLPEIYSSHDVSVLPSEKEALGKVLLESMSCGRPVISTRSGGITDIVNDGKNGLLVPPRNPQALAEALGSIIQNTSMRRKMGSLARKKALNFDWKSIALSYLDAFQEILD
jgi:glycosyltransferase involved in cell wall biosynthesis